jgi:hypothetical protein
MKKITLLAIAASCLATATFAQSGNSLHLKKGQKYIVESIVSTKSSTEAQGQTMESNIDATTTYNIEVNDIVSDNYNLTNTVNNVKMKMSMMGQEMNFDSDKQEDLDGPMGAPIKDYIKKPNNVVLDKSGKVIAQKKDTSNDALSPTSRFANFEATGFGAQMAFEPLPKNLKAGTIWTSKTDEGGISKTTNYTVKEIKGDLATITLNGTMTTDVKMEQQGMQMAAKTSGKFSGEEVVNIKTGVIQTNTTTADASGNVEVMGQEIPTSYKVTTTTTVKAL